MSQNRVDRRLTTILSADIVGYSRLMSTDEVGTLAFLKAHRQELVEPKAAEYHGRVVKLFGDGTLMEFGSVVDAVNFAADVQRMMAERNAGLPEDRRVTYRVGINVGDVIVDGEDIYGDGVNVAARLETLAEPGGICVSHTVFDHVKSKVALRFDDIGDQKLKNIPEAIHVYVVRASTLAMDGVSESAGPVYHPDSRHSTNDTFPTIVVMPFENLSDDPSQEFFCDGLTEVVTAEIAKFHHLFVIAAHSAFVYKGRKVSARQVGGELGVQYLLEGSVQRSSDRVRVSAQLIETASGLHLWAERFDVTGIDVFLVQDEIIKKIVAVLALKVDLSEQKQVLRRDTLSPSAYECYLRGVHLYSQTSQEQMGRAQEMFRKACELDPNFARAWGYLAYTHTRSFILGWADQQALQEALECATRAVTLDSDDYSNLWDLAFVHLNMGRVDQALREYERALEFNQNDSDMLADMAVALVYAGEPERAVELLEKAMKINPYFPDWYRWNMGWAHFNARHYELAVEHLSQIADPAKNVWLKLATSFARLNRKADARSALCRFMEMEPGCTAGRVADRFPFKRKRDRDHWRESLLLAGLPE